MLKTLATKDSVARPQARSCEVSPRRAFSVNRRGPAGTLIDSTFSTRHNCQDVL